MGIYCRRADIKCVIIDGISKGGDYEVGLPEQDLAKMRDRCPRMQCIWTKTGDLFILIGAQEDQPT